MKLEPIIQSEVGQKEKNQYSILKHIYYGKKQIASLRSIQDTGCLELVHGDDPER